MKADHFMSRIRAYRIIQGALVVAFIGVVWLDSLAPIVPALAA